MQEAHQLKKKKKTVTGTGRSDADSSHERHANLHWMARERGWVCRKQAGDVQRTLGTVVTRLLGYCNFEALEDLIVPRVRPDSWFDFNSSSLLKCFGDLPPYLSKKRDAHTPFVERTLNIQKMLGFLSVACPVRP